MLLEKAIQDHHRVAELLEAMEKSGRRKHNDDILVRPYVVQAHWRRRWHPNVVSMATLKKRRRIGR
jgi:hypothetical protein